MNGFMDSVLWMNDSKDGHSLAVNKVMLTVRATSFLYNCRDETPIGFVHTLSLTSGRPNLDFYKKFQEEETKNVVAKELTVATNGMGEGYRLIGNKVMLLARVDAKSQTGMDLMPYEFIDMLNTVYSPIQTVKTEKPKKSKKTRKQKVQKVQTTIDGVI